MAIGKADFAACSDYVEYLIQDALDMSDAGLNSQELARKIMGNLRDPSEGDRGRHKVRDWVSAPVEYGVYPIEWEKDAGAEK